MDNNSGTPMLVDYLALTAEDMKTSLVMMAEALEAMTPGTAARQEPVYSELVHTLEYTRRLNDSLEQWIALYRQGGQGVPFSPKRQGVGVLVDQLLAQERARLCFAGVVLETSYDPGLVWEYDAALLCSVLHHAIQNAMHYASDKVHLQLAVRGASLEIRVDDNGQGFPQAMLDAGVAALSGMYRGVNFATRSTGLGLYFSREVIGMHGHEGKRASLRLENGGAYGGGCFIITVP
jgi:two-component system sensor histidine kinase SenX3